MAKVVIFLAHGFEEIEAFTPIDFLRRAGADVTVAGVENKVIISARNIKVETDVLANSINANDFDAVVLPGGSTKLSESKDVIKTVQEIFKAGKLVAAICAAPLVLDLAGVLVNKKYTMYPHMHTNLKSGNYVDRKVVTDGNIITGAGPAASAEFAFTVIRYILGEKIAKEVEDATLFSKFN